MLEGEFVLFTLHGCGVLACHLRYKFWIRSRGRWTKKEWWWWQLLFGIHVSVDALLSEVGYILCECCLSTRLAAMYDEDTSRNEELSVLFLSPISSVILVFMWCCRAGWINGFAVAKVNLQLAWSSFSSSATCSGHNGLIIETTIEFCCVYCSKLVLILALSITSINYKICDVWWLRSRWIITD